jgi:peptidyl-prolyl cis-trans isomerase C
VAQKIIDQLNGGANFATLAKQMSSDKGSAAKGGDLGWFSPTDMAKPFSDAIALLKNGEYTKSPVQTSFGWHVVQLLGTRDRAPPAFEGVQDQIKQMLLSRKFRAYSDEMVRAAKVDPPLANMPAAPTAPASTAATPAPAPAAPAEPKTN